MGAEQPSAPAKQEGCGEDAPHFSRLPRRDRAALPARALGPKATQIHARKQRAKGPAEPTAPARADRWCMATADQALSYVLQADAAGLYVERRQRRPLGADVVQSMVFATLQEFDRWCDADPLRFDEPVLHGGLRRQGERFFDVDR